MVQPAAKRLVTEGALGTSTSPARSALTKAYALPRAGTFAIIGDSISARSKSVSVGASPVTQVYLETGWHIHALRSLGWRGTYVGNFAVSGKRADEVLAEQVPQVLAMNPLPAFVIVAPLGVNDLAFPVDAATTKARLAAVYDALNNAGIHVIASTLTPKASATYKANLMDVNHWIRGQMATRSRFDVIDFFTPMADINGEPLAGVLVDGLHPTATGAAIMGKAAAATLDRLLPLHVPLPTPASTANLLNNPFQTGTAGALGTGVTGTVSSNWYVGAASGSLTAVASKVARTDGVPGEWQQVAVTSGSARVSTVGHPLTGFTAGSNVIAYSEVQCDPSMLTATTRLELYIQFDAPTTQAASSSYWTSPDPQTPIYLPSTVVLATPVMTIPTGVTIVTMMVRAWNANGGTFRVGRGAFYKV